MTKNLLKLLELDILTVLDPDALQFRKTQGQKPLINHMPKKTLNPEA